MRFSSLFPLAVLAFPLASSGCGSPSDDEENFAKIPLAEVYFTSIQKDLKGVSFGENLPYQDRLENFNKMLPFASNLFLTRAKDINEAIGAGLRFRGSENMTIPKKDDDRLWLIVFFGHSYSSPRRWTIESVEYNQSRIRVNYSLPTGAIQATRDLYPYFVFVPLMKFQPKPGTFVLELRDFRSKEVMLMRKIRFYAPEPLGKRQ